MNIKSFFSPSLHVREGWRVKLLLATLLLSSCSADESIPADHAIRLTCGVNGVSAFASTRSALSSDNLPEEGLEVRFARTNEQADGSFAPYSSVSPLPATLFRNGNVTFSEKQFYRESGALTRFVGWHPAGTFSNGAVTFPLNGTTDVMLTGEVEGSLSQPFNTTDRSFTFSHLLTQLQVVGYVMAEVDVVKYGKITSITLAGQRDACTVALPSGTAVFSETASTRTLKNPADDTDMPAVSLSGTTLAAPASCGYLLIPPGAHSLELAITTEKYGTYPLRVNLAAGKAFEAGKTYTVRLSFGGNGVAPEVLVADWNDAGRTIIDIERIK